MKKRDLFWTTRLICFFAIILLFTFLFFHHIIQFNSSYIQEEKDTGGSESDYACDCTGYESTGDAA